MVGIVPTAKMEAYRKVTGLLIVLTELQKYLTTTVHMHADRGPCNALRIMYFGE